MAIYPYPFPTIAEVLAPPTSLAAKWGKNEKLLQEAQAWNDSITKQQAKLAVHLEQLNKLIALAESGKGTTNGELAIAQFDKLNATPKKWMPTLVEGRLVADGTVVER